MDRISKFSNQPSGKPGEVAEEQITISPSEEAEYRLLMTEEGMQSFNHLYKYVIQTYKHNLSPDALDDILNGRDAETNRFLIGELGVRNRYNQQRSQVIRQPQLIIKCVRFENNRNNGKYSSELEQWKNFLENFLQNAREY